MYYSLEEHNGSEAAIEVSVLKGKVTFLKKQMEKSMAAFCVETGEVIYVEGLLQAGGEEAALPSRVLSD